MRDVKREETPTDIDCEKCGKPMVIKWGKMGRFLACSGLPGVQEHQGLQEKADGKIVPVEEQPTDEMCEKCGRPMAIKRGRFGRFLACTGYPECKTSKPLSIGVSLPDLQGGLAHRAPEPPRQDLLRLQPLPGLHLRRLGPAAPGDVSQCALPYLLQKYSKREGPYIACPNKECGYRRSVDDSGTSSAA